MTCLWLASVALAAVVAWVVWDELSRPTRVRNDDWFHWPRYEVDE